MQLAMNLMNIYSDSLNAGFLEVKRNRAIHWICLIDRVDEVLILMKAQVE
jgi:hypothetical protein